MTAYDYEAVRQEYPGLKLPHLSELSGELWLRVTSSILPKLSRQKFTALLVAETLSADPGKVAVLKFSRKSSDGRGPKDEVITSVPIVGFPLLENLLRKQSRNP